MSQELFDEAIRLEENGEEVGALSVWRELAISNPTRNVFLRLASCAKGLGLIDEAERAFVRALEIDNRSAPALLGLGILAINRRDYEAAEGYLKRARAVEECPSTLSILGVALRNLGKDLEAEEAYRRAIYLDSQYEEAYYNLGVLLRDERPSEARTLFRKAWSSIPTMRLLIENWDGHFTSAGRMRKQKATLGRRWSSSLTTHGRISTLAATFGEATLNLRSRSSMSPAIFSRTGQFRFGLWGTSMNL